MFPKSHVKVLNWLGSDHLPLVLYTEDQKWRANKLFRYDNRWRFKSEAKEVIQKTWNQECESLPPDRFNEALKNCRNSLARWKSTQNNNSHKRIQELKDLIHQAYDSKLLEYSYRSSLKTDLIKEYRLEEEYWRTKIRVQWLQAGDKNTRYFHEKTKQRRNFNRILSINDGEGRTWFGEKDIQRIIVSYFIGLFYTECRDDAGQFLQLVAPKVTAEMNN